MTIIIPVTCCREEVEIELVEVFLGKVNLGVASNSWDYTSIIIANNKITTTEYDHNNTVTHLHPLTFNILKNSSIQCHLHKLHTCCFCTELLHIFPGPFLPTLCLSGADFSEINPLWISVLPVALILLVY